MTSTGLDNIRMQVMWNRLISVVEEQALTLIRTAFSTSVREAGDLSAGIFDRQGRMVAQAVTGTPGHVNAMAESVLHFLNEIPSDQIFEGDCYVTNDPWKGTGHLHDITMVAPSHLDGKLVGFFACTAHVVDIGGRGFGADGKSVYEEGIQIPIMKFVERGEVNQNLIHILRVNVRQPNQLVGDFYSLAACNEVGHRRLVDMMRESGLTDIEDLAEFIFARSRQATLDKINQLPRGSFENDLTIDGYDEPLYLATKLTISEDNVHADFSGTSPISRWGINVPLVYTKAYSGYGLKCAIAPEVPNNTASLAPFTVSAPEGCILNAVRPAPVALRHITGHMLPDLVMGALDKSDPGKMPAEGAGSIWNLHISARPVAGTKGRHAEVLMFNSGGSGARAELDGLNATAFPSGVMTMPIEATEHTGPIVVWRKELRPGSGGAGRQRGGLGQIIEIGALDGHEFDFSAMFDRIQYPPRGRNGGANGQNGAVYLNDGTKMRAKGWQFVPSGKRIVLELPGGGGNGDPTARSNDALKRDLAGDYLDEVEIREAYDRSPDEF